MYPDAFTTEGQLLPDGTLDLSAAPPFKSGPVEVTVRPLTKSNEPKEDWWEYLQRARAELEALGHRFSTKEEIDAYIEDLRRDRDDPYEQLGK